MKTITQSHWTLYQRYSAMVSVLEEILNPNDEQKAAKKQLTEQADEHYRKAQILGTDRFLMVVSQ